MLLKHLTIKKFTLALLLGVLLLAPNYSPVSAQVPGDGMGAVNTANAASDKAKKALLDDLNAATTAQYGEFNEQVCAPSTDANVKSRCRAINKQLAIAQGGQEASGGLATLDEKLAYVKDAAAEMDRMITTAQNNTTDPEKLAELAKLKSDLEAGITQAYDSAVASQEDRIAEESSCGWTNPFACIWDAIKLFIATVVDAIVWVISWILYLANEIFAYTLKISVRDFATYANLPGVANGWAILRDLLNIVFIGALFYIAIGTILQISGLDWKKMVTSLVVAALLVNFSMVFTKIIIDASNILALTFYDSLSVRNGVAQVTASGNPDISTQIIQGLSVNRGESLQIIKPNQPPNSTTVPILSIYEIIGGGLGKIVMILVTSFVLIAASVMFLIRTVTLIFLLILSPIAFVGWILPYANQWQSMWWKRLIKESLFAPAYLFCFFVVVRLLQASNLQTSLGGASGAFLPLVVYFIIVIGLMMGCLFIANTMGATGAKFATQTAGKLVGGAPAWLGRNTIGRGAAALGRSETLQKAATSQNVFTRMAAMGALRGADSTAKSSFDVRASRLGQNLAGQVNADVGKTQTGGYRADIEAREKKDKEDAKLVAPQTALDEETASAENKEYIEDTTRQTELKEIEKTLTDAELAMKKDPEYQSLDQSLQRSGEELEGFRTQTQVAEKNLEELNRELNEAPDWEKGQIRNKITDAEATRKKAKDGLSRSQKDYDRTSGESKKYIDQKLEGSEDKDIRKAYAQKQQLASRGVISNIEKARIRTEAGTKGYDQGETDKSVADYIKQQGENQKKYASGKYHKEQLAERNQEVGDWLDKYSGGALGKRHKEAAATMRKANKEKKTAEKLQEEIEKKIKEDQTAISSSPT